MLQRGNDFPFSASLSLPHQTPDRPSSMRLRALEMNWRRLADNGVLSALFATGPNRMQRQRSGSDNTLQPSVHRERERKRGVCLCFWLWGLCWEGGEGGGFVSYDLHYGPSRSYKAGAPFSYVSIRRQILDSKWCWLCARPQSPLW